jgi:hypothetical protein
MIHVTGSSWQTSDILPEDIVVYKIEMHKEEVMSNCIILVLLTDSDPVEIL